jgi:hypothetical protein
VPEEVAHLEAVRQAVLEDRELHLRHRARGGDPFDDTVRPLGLVAKASGGRGRTGVARRRSSSTSRRRSTRWRAWPRATGSSRSCARRA